MDPAINQIYQLLQQQQQQQQHHLAKFDPNAQQKLSYKFQHWLFVFSPKEKPIFIENILYWKLLFIYTYLERDEIKNNELRIFQVQDVYNTGLGQLLKDYVFGDIETYQNINFSIKKIFEIFKEANIQKQKEYIHYETYLQDQDQEKIYNAKIQVLFYDNKSGLLLTSQDEKKMLNKLQEQIEQLSELQTNLEDNEISLCQLTNCVLGLMKKNDVKDLNEGVFLLLKELGLLPFDIQKDNVHFESQFLKDQQIFHYNKTQSTEQTLKDFFLYVFSNPWNFSAMYENYQFDKYSQFYLQNIQLKVSHIQVKITEEEKQAQKSKNVHFADQSSIPNLDLLMSEIQRKDGEKFVIIGRNQDTAQIDKDLNRKPNLIFAKNDTMTSKAQLKITEKDTKVALQCLGSVNSCEIVLKIPDNQEIDNSQYFNPQQQLNILQNQVFCIADQAQIFINKIQDQQQKSIQKAQQQQKPSDSKLHEQIGELKLRQTQLNKNINQNLESIQQEMEEDNFRSQQKPLQLEYQPQNQDLENEDKFQQGVNIQNDEIYSCVMQKNQDDMIYVSSQSMQISNSNTTEMSQNGNAPPKDSRSGDSNSDGSTQKESSGSNIMRKQSESEQTRSKNTQQLSQQYICRQFVTNSNESSEHFRSQRKDIQNQLIKQSQDSDRMKSNSNTLSKSRNINEQSSQNPFVTQSRCIGDNDMILESVQSNTCQLQKIDEDSNLDNLKNGIPFEKYETLNEDDFIEIKCCLINQNIAKNPFSDKNLRVTRVQDLMNKSERKVYAICIGIVNNIGQEEEIISKTEKEIGQNKYFTFNWLQKDKKTQEKNQRIIDKQGGKHQIIIQYLPPGVWAVTSAQNTNLLIKQYDKLRKSSKEHHRDSDLVFLDQPFYQKQTTLLIGENLVQILNGN